LFKGWVANQIDPDMLFIEDSIHTLTEHFNAPPLAIMPMLQSNDYSTIDSSNYCGE
jgi:hypothetical protein